MIKTLLIVACPGSGKSHWAKSQNKGLNPLERPVIDFDYRGTRFSGTELAEVAKAQSALFNSFAKAGAAVITTHFHAFDYDTLDHSQIAVWYFVPADVECLQWYAKNVVFRDPGQVSEPWVKQYCKSASRKEVVKLQNNALLSINHVGDRVYYMNKGEYLGDVLDKEIFDWYVRNISACRPLSM